MERFNELETAVWTVDLIASTGIPAVPSTVHWRLTCLETDTVLQAWTSLTPTITYDASGNPEESYVSITVPSTLNAMQTTDKARERKVITVTMEKDAANESPFEIEYEVVRLKGRSD